ncbi:helix-turn-helix domain-containing protein [Chlorogloeopsis fritschii PCC 9212]|uniref:helix-turn-helix domain-containing protein n=1 Tax=Chlorogloeopsis fritschii TaxID=1124 RepID=UPI00370DAA24
MDIDKAKIDKFAEMAQAIDKRIANLYENASAIPPMPDILPDALLELAMVSQKMHYAMEELYHQNEQLVHTQNILETERQHYQELFEEAPFGYLVTDIEGKIQQANNTVVRLFNIDKRLLVSKLMINFVALEERQHFRNFLRQLSEPNKSQELVIRLQKRSKGFFDASLIVVVARDNQGKPQTLRWLLRDITKYRQAELARDYDFGSDRPTHRYSKGEIVPLNPQIIWYVRKGAIKLTTVCETSEEMLVGLAVQGMVFGSHMTSLYTYQATALVDAELVSIHLLEITASPLLSHIILPKINQRLKQTESFLAIFGCRKIKDCLYLILQLLKQEVGEKVAQGTRLSIRLTHEDFANACSTSRVTITRLMSKLKQQGKICFDDKKHLILRNID